MVHLDASRPGVYPPLITSPSGDSCQKLNLSTTATLGLEASGHCREVETRVNVWTARQNKMAVVERWPLMEVRSITNIEIKSTKEFSNKSH